MIDKIKKLLSSIEKESSKKTIVAFKGFPYSELIKLDNKYFTQWDKIIVNKIDLVKSKIVCKLPRLQYSTLISQ